MRVRLRSKWSDEKLAELYAAPYDHTKWDEHRQRIIWTANRINQLIALTRPQIHRVADLSCGNGALIDMIALGHDGEKICGDLVFTERLDVIGPIEETVRMVSGDLLICSETLEHLDDPDTVLRDARENFEWLVLTTPLGETDPKKNYEHYWGWDMLGVGVMLEESGWHARSMETLNMPYYTYQLWTARRSR